MGKLHSRDFYERHPRIVARALMGKVLRRRLPSGEFLSGRIVEAEAYLGADDAAAHAAAGKTPRNAVLFGPAGHAYVYFTYGMHYCMNISCQPEGRAGCVLLRALEPLQGEQQMAGLRGMPKLESGRRKLLASGPGRLCQALGISRERDNGKDLTSADSDLQVLDDGYRPGKIIRTTRIGITRSTELPLRFVLAGNPYVSGKKL
jgi:DNA-3-methyladenine glycosylase